MAERFVGFNLWGWDAMNRFLRIAAVAAAATFGGRFAIAVPPPPLPGDGTAHVRTWTDSTGKFSLEADFVSYAAGQVTLKKPDGTTVALSLDKLSKADQDFLKTLVPELRTPPAAGNDNPFAPKAAAQPKAQPAPPRLPKGVDAAALKKAEDAVNSLFKDDLANARTPQQRAELAAKLLQTAKDTRDDPASQFVLLRKAAELAAIAGDAGTAFAAIEQLDAVVDTLPIWAGTLDTLSKNSKTASRAADKADSLIDRAYGKDDYDPASRLAGIMLAAARTARDPALLRAATARASEVAAAQAEFKKLAPAREKLANTPLDPAANAAIGRFLCFVKRDWNRGIPMLSLGDDKSLNRVAALELRDTKTIHDFVTLGDLWMELTKGNDNLSAAQERAAYWYNQALPNVSGLVKVRIEKQLAAVSAGNARNYKMVAEKSITNSIGMKLVLIPAGEFQMGSPEEEKERKNNEKRHRVRITRPYYMGVYPVTQSEYQHVAQSNPSYFSTGGNDSGTVAGMDTSRFPVEQVSWYDAEEFCKRLSQKEGKTYRLPTEAEWEYACRAGSTTPFNFGSSCNGREANCRGQVPYGTGEKGPFLGRTAPVGSYRPNAFGLYDMHGNLWQLCADCYDENYYQNSPTDDPQGPAAGSGRVHRGGGWWDPPVDCRCSSRRGIDAAARNNLLGFRVVREP